MSAADLVHLDVTLFTDTIITYLIIHILYLSVSVPQALVE